MCNHSIYSIEPEPVQLTECYADFPFAFAGGQYCCEFQVENSETDADGNLVETCSGNTLTLDSTCCKDNAKKDCPKDVCINYGRFMILTLK